MCVECNDELPQVPIVQPRKEELVVGRHIAEIIKDGATLQLGKRYAKCTVFLRCCSGTGGIQEAVLMNLKRHKNIGLHTETFSDGVIELLKSGVINNRVKKIMPNISVASFLYGSKLLHDYVNENPTVVLLRSSYAADPAVISKNPTATSINGAIEVDLTGQICADSIGGKIYSGVGSQMDFMRCAQACSCNYLCLCSCAEARRGLREACRSLRFAPQQAMDFRESLHSCILVLVL